MVRKLIRFGLAGMVSLGIGVAAAPAFADDAVENAAKDVGSATEKGVKDGWHETESAAKSVTGTGKDDGQLDGGGRQEHGSAGRQRDRGHRQAGRRRMRPSRARQEAGEAAKNASDATENAAKQGAGRHQAGRGRHQGRPPNKGDEKARRDVRQLEGRRSPGGLTANAAAGSAA